MAGTPLARAVQPGYSTEMFRSGGRMATVEWWHAAHDAALPGLLVVHDPGTESSKSRPDRRLARDLVLHGYHVFLLAEEPVDMRVSDLASERREFEQSLRLIGDALTWMSGLGAVDRKRIGLVGVGSGAPAVLAASAGEQRVAALAEVAGGLPEWVAAQNPRLPPTLILHGALDSWTPVEEAYALERYVKGAGVSYAIHIYERQGHTLRGSEERDAARRMTLFFDRYLTGSPPAKAGLRAE